MPAEAMLSESYRLPSPILPRFCSILITFWLFLVSSHGKLLECWALDRGCFCLVDQFVPPPLVGWISLLVKPLTSQSPAFCKTEQFCLLLLIFSNSQILGLSFGGFRVKNLICDILER